MASKWLWSLIKLCANVAEVKKNIPVIIFNEIFLRKTMAPNMKMRWFDPRKWNGKQENRLMKQSKYTEQMKNAVCFNCYTIVYNEKCSTHKFQSKS